MPCLSRLETTNQNVKLDRSVIVGRGRIATVFGGTFKDVKVAIKRIVLLDVHQQLLNDDSEKLKQIASFQHSNVLKLFGSYSDENFRYFVMELYIASVFDYCCDKYKGEVPDQVNSLYQMASGLHYIHCQGFVHRNIKPENVLISSSIQLKISDIDLTKPISIEKALSLTSDGRPSSPSMQAPEILQPMDLDKELSDTESEALHTFSSDIFSLGCLFFYFLTKKGHPFLSKESRKINNIILNIIEGKYDLSELGDDHFAVPIITKMIRLDVTQRIDLHTVVQYLKCRIT